MTAMSIPRPRAGVLAIEPYVGGESVIAGRSRVFKLSSNESPLGPSPRAVAAYQGAAGDLAIYPKGDARELRQAIAALHDLEPERVMLGAGSDEILNLLAHAYLGPGDEALATENSFIVYRIATQSAGARPVLAPERGHRTDFESLLARVTDRTKIVYLANPNNPTGTYVTRKELESFHATLPPNILLVLDAAYAEYAGPSDYADGAELARHAKNVVMTRTFSKAYGLAGLRLGWAYGPLEVCDILNRVRGPFNTSVPAQAAGLAAIADQEHLARAVAHNARWLPELARGISSLGFHVVPSVGNFLLIEFGSLENAHAVDVALRDAGIIVRGLRNYGFESALRLSVGTDEANALMLSTLETYVKRRSP